MRLVPARVQSHPKISVIIGVVVITLLVWGGYLLFKPGPGQNFAAVNSYAVGQDLGKGVAPSLQTIIIDGNDSRAKLNATNKEMKDLAKRFDDSFNAFKKRVDEIEGRQLNHEMMIKGVQDQLKNLPKAVPLSQLEALQKEVAELRTGFPKRATA